MKKKNNKKLIIALLLVVTLCMGIGYSILSRQLKIQGAVSVDNGFDVQITNIEKFANGGKDYYRELGSSAGDPLNGTVTETEKPSFTATTANFNVKLGVNTSIAYLITIENKGNVPATFDPATITKSGLEDVVVETPVDLTNVLLAPGESVEYLVNIKYEYSDDMNEGTATEVEVALNAKQTTSSNNIAPLVPYILFAEGRYNSNNTIRVRVINPQAGGNALGNIRFLNIALDDYNGPDVNLPYNGAAQGESYFTMAGTSPRDLQIMLGDNLFQNMTIGDHVIKIVYTTYLNNNFSDTSNIINYHFYYAG